MVKRLTPDELINREARTLAQNELEKRLAMQNLPPPRDIDKHVDQMLTMIPAFREQAKLNVEARQDAYSEALKTIGINHENTAEALDLKF